MSARLYTRLNLRQLLTKTITSISSRPYHPTSINFSEALQPDSEPQKREFQAETRQLLDIVAKSLYSEREVFLRELVSNAADALEKLRYNQLKGAEIDDPAASLKIEVSLSDALKSITIEDNGLGMTKEEMISNLGTIARSGSKEFVKNASSSGDNSTNVIGQFGVGFYSAFMVGSHVTVLTKSAKPGSTGYVWNSNGADGYDIKEAAGLSRGTRIVIQLKEDAMEFCQKDRIRDVIKKHNNFVGFPIYLDGTQVNTIEPLWTRKSSDITDAEHTDFFQSLSERKDSPLYAMQFSVETPVNIKCVLYTPKYMPQLDLSNLSNVGISLYCKKVLVQTKNPKLLPEWLLFLQGVVDSEDIPLNLSRELLQESVIISKIKDVITGKMIAYLNRQAKRDPAKYEDFYREFGRFIRVGMVTTESQTEREDLAKLLRFESSKEEKGVVVSLDQYMERAAEGQKQIYYLSCPNREMALESPYFETLQQNDIEVLFTYNKEDDVVLFRLEDYKDRKLCTAEAANVKPVSKSTDIDGSRLDKKEGNKLATWFRDSLGRENVKEVKISDRQHSHPAVVSVENLAQLRQYLQMAPPDQKEASYKYLLHNNVVLELNPEHDIIKQLSSLSESNPAVADLVAAQLFDNALMNADLIHDPRRMVSRINQILRAVTDASSKIPETDSSI